MLDFDLISKSYNHALNQFDNRTDTEMPGLYTVQNFLLADLLAKLHTLIATDLDWQCETVQSGAVPYPNRMKLNWIPDSVIEETHTVLEQLTADINHVFARNNRFLGLSIWKDIAGYKIASHTDNPTIDIALQVYLSGHNCLDLGTEFEHCGSKYRVPYIVNTGYVMDNTKKLQHRMMTPVPANYVRYSLYAMWTRI